MGGLNLIKYTKALCSSYNIVWKVTCKQSCWHFTWKTIKEIEKCTGLSEEVIQEAIQRKQYKDSLPKKEKDEEESIIFCFYFDGELLKE